METPLLVREDTMEHAPNSNPCRVIHQVRVILTQLSTSMIFVSQGYLTSAASTIARAVVLVTVGHVLQREDLHSKYWIVM